MKTIDEMIEVMTAYKNGAEIESKPYVLEYWSNNYSPQWDWVDCEYRIKEQKKKVVMEKWLLKIKGKEIYFEYSSNDIDLYVTCQVGIEKVKLLDSYEVEVC